MAEILQEMFVLVAVDCKVGAKKLRSIAAKANLTKDELYLVNQGIAEYLKRRARLNRTLTIKGELGVIKMLVQGEYLDTKRLRISDAALKVGPFSYNVYVDSEKLALVSADIADENNGYAMTEDKNRPWSIVVRDRTAVMRPEMALLALFDRELTSSRTERHEDMHQFYAFLQRLCGTYGGNDEYLELMKLKTRMDRLVSLNTPELIVKGARERLESEATKLGVKRGSYGFDWLHVEAEARRQCAAELEDRIKSELLAFLWAQDAAGIRRRIKCGYLCRWIETAERMLGLDLSVEMEELLGTLDVAIAGMDAQVQVLKDTGMTDGYKIMQLVAMLNIDRPLSEWGTDI